MPKSRIWHAPEWHDRAFLPEDAKRMDMFSFGMVCLWFLFGVDMSIDLTEPASPRISFEEHCDPRKDLLEMWKFDDLKDELVAWALSIIPESVGTKAASIATFFRATLVKAPQKRELNMDKLLPLLDPARYIWGQRINFSRIANRSAPARYVSKPL